MPSPTLSTDLQENIRYLEAELPLSTSFDLITRKLFLGDTPAFFIGVNGFCRTEVLQQIFSDLQNPLYMQDARVEDIARYVSGKIGYAQVSMSDSWDKIITNVLSGPVVLIIHGFSQAILIDARTYPTRGV